MVPPNPVIGGPSPMSVVRRSEEIRRERLKMRDLVLKRSGSTHREYTLPTDVVAASSLSTFRRLLKRFLFKQSYPGIIY